MNDKANFCVWNEVVFMRELACVHLLINTRLTNRVYEWQREAAGRR